MADWQIEQLTKLHERGQFCCGKASLDEYLRQRAGQYERRGIGRTYVAVRSGEARVLGYYTLAAGAVAFDHLPPKTSHKLPRHPIPVVLLCRLAVDQSVQGHGLGADLLMDALRRSLELSERVAVYAVEVFALDREARSFYRKYGFLPLTDDELHLYLPIAAIRDGLAQ